MISFLLNPGGKKRRKGRKKYSKKSRAARRAASYRRGARRRTHRRYAAKFKASISNLLCRKGWSKRVKALRRRSCSISSKGAPKHGGLAGIIASRSAPGVISRNPRRKGSKFKYRRKARNYSHYIPAYSENPYWVPSYAMNPGGAVGITSGFKPSTLTKAVPYVVGVIGNVALSGLVSKHLPSMLQEGIPNILVGIGTAGLMGVGAGMLSKQYAGPVFFGGVVEALSRLAITYVMPLVKKIPGLGDYLTQADVVAATPLGCFGGGCMGMYGVEDPLNGWLQSSGTTPDSYLPQINQLMGDYLTPQNAADARPLGALGYTANDAAIEGTATADLEMD